MSWARSANDRWKQRWSSWVLRSTIIAAGFHAVVFVLWPLWDIDYVPPAQSSEMVQITPVISRGNLSEPETLALAAVPDDASQEEVRRDEGGSGTEEDVELFTTAEELYNRLPDPSLAYPVLPTGVYGRPAPPLDAELNLDRLTTIDPQVVKRFEVDWPKIRNPTMIVRFLRYRYGELLADPTATGSVSVSMVVDERGRVQMAQVSHSSGHQGLDEIALALFNDVVIFTPARREGDAIPLGVEITVPFTIPW